MRGCRAGDLLALLHEGSLSRTAPFLYSRAQSCPPAGSFSSIRAFSSTLAAACRAPAGSQGAPRTQAPSDGGLALFYGVASGDNERRAGRTQALGGNAVRAFTCLRDVSRVARAAVSDARPFCARLNSKAIQNDIMRQVVETAVDLGETAVVRTHRLWRDLSKVRAGLA